MHIQLLRLFRIPYERVPSLSLGQDGVWQVVRRRVSLGFQGCWICALDNALRQMARRFWQLRRHVAVLSAELALAGLSYALTGYVLRQFEGDQGAWQVLPKTMLYLLAFRLASLLYVGVFKCSFRYAGVHDLIRIGKAVSLSSLLFFVFTRLCLAHLHFPALLFIIDWTLLQFLLGGLHFSTRVYEAQRAMSRKNGKRVVILGAGAAGIAVLRELALDSSSPFLPVAVLDDDSQKHGATICGVPVLGSLAELARVAREKRADEILICIPSATGPQMSRILAACRECGIPVKTLPSVAELISGKVSRRDLHSIRVEDILQREEAHYDLEAVGKVVSGKTVLVTGAGGTIGSELCRQIAAAGPRTLLLLDKSENSLFYSHLELRERFPSLQAKALLVDVVHGDLVRKVLCQEQPEVVFHAAAFKHVGLQELHPHEAIRNNVIGTRNVALAALESQVDRFVNISTDKAVNPRNYMGLSKKLAELCIQELARRNSVRFMSVRFGNVAGSTGSVLRLFWDQIQKGGPLRVTDPRATRYFMSIPQAVYLIFRAAALGQGGETFIFDMGEPINIYELARTVSLFSGLAPGKDVPIQFMGLREGEKIHEELWEEWERPRPTQHEQILVIGDSNPLSFEIVEKIQQLEDYVIRDDRAGMLEYLHRLVPSFAASRRHSTTAPPALAAARSLDEAV